MQTNNRMFVIGTIVIGIGALLIPGMNLAPAVLAGKIQMEQFAHQLNACTGGSSCDNTARNSASVNTPQSDTTNTVKVHQHIDQANLCSGEGTSCSNSGTNEAVTLVHEGFHIIVHQHIDQANLCSGKGTSCSNSATNKWSPANFQH
jgi:hypothetical protein